MDFQVCQHCSKPFQRMKSAGKWECSYHPKPLEEYKGFMRWSCCKRRYAYDNPNLSYDYTDYRSLQRFRERVFPHNGMNYNVGCTPCDHERQNVEQAEIREACQNNDVTITDLQGSDEQFRLYWCKSVKGCSNEQGNFEC